MTAGMTYDIPLKGIKRLVVGKKQPSCLFRNGTTLHISIGGLAGYINAIVPFLSRHSLDHSSNCAMSCQKLMKNLLSHRGKRNYHTGRLLHDGRIVSRWLLQPARQNSQVRPCSSFGMHGLIGVDQPS